MATKKCTKTFLFRFNFVKIQQTFLEQFLYTVLDTKNINSTNSAIRQTFIGNPQCDSNIPDTILDIEEKKIKLK